VKADLGEELPQEGSGVVGEESVPVVARFGDETQTEMLERLARSMTAEEHNRFPKGRW